MTSCHQCDSQVENDDIFCKNCGANLRVQENLRLAQFPAEGPLNNDLLNRFLYLESKIDNLKDLDGNLSDQRVYANSLANEERLSFEKLQGLRRQSKKELKDVDRLKGLTIASLKARLTGTKVQLLRREEQEYFRAVAAEQVAHDDHDAVQKKLMTARTQLAELETLNTQKTEMKSELTRLADSLTHGLPDPVEDALENEFETLNGDRVALAQKKTLLTSGRGHLQNGYSYLQSALENLNSAKGFADWDTFIGGGLFVDSIKHSRVSEATQHAYQARRSLELANQVLKGEVGRIYVAEVEQSSFLWDGFFDNIFSDLNARDRIIRSRDALGDSLNQTGISIEWIRSRIAETDESLRKLEVKYEGVREKLTNERIRMIRERMSGK